MIRYLSIFIYNLYLCYLNNNIYIYVAMVMLYFPEWEFEVTKEGGVDNHLERSGDVVFKVQ